MSDSIIRSTQEIEDHIHCEKILLNKPKKATEKNRNVTQRFVVQALKNGNDYSVFITWSSRMPQDFSIGLMYEDYLLFRCNGFHGTTRNRFLIAHHAYPHGHLLTMEDIQNGRSKKPTQIIDFTGKYMEVRTATRFFFQECNISDSNDFFNFRQLSLFD